MAGWFPHRKVIDAPRARIFCFPHAGGGASSFRAWRALLPADVELCAVELPGRETRFTEPAHSSMSTLLPDLLAAVRPLTNVPFALVGHSLGAIVAFEIGRSLAAGHDASRAAIVVACGHPAPHLPRRQTPIASLSDTDLEMQLRKLNGSPPEFWQHPELKELLLPILRADLEVAESYRYTARAPLTWPILAFGGSDDPNVPPADLHAWRDHTSGLFRATILPGDHFFIRNRAPELVRALLDVLGFAPGKFDGVSSPRARGPS